MEITRYLEALAVKEPDQRRQALAGILETENLKYILQEEAPSFKNPRGVANYLIEPEDTGSYLLFCAHYDAVPGSFGANDNAAAVCILIALAKELMKRRIVAGFAFFDGEESKNAGSRLYASQINDRQLAGVVNLDVCGYGDTLVICGHFSNRRPSLLPFRNKKILDRYNGRVVEYLPKGDEASFRGSRIPAMSIAMMPRWDIQYLKALASYGDGFLGRPPEFDMMIEQMEVSSTMHGGCKDAPRYVEPEAMTRVYDYILDVMHEPPQKGFRIF